MGDLGRRRLLRTLRAAALTTAAGVVVFGAAVPAAAQNHNPPGANGTVKIDTNEGGDSGELDGKEPDRDIRNHPHVGCVFKVRFFNFDKDQTATIRFDIQPPSGPVGTELRTYIKTISDDAAGGANNDPDAVFTYTAEELGLSEYKIHEKHGYHVKLTVTLDETSTPKHKVFWVQPCQWQSPSSPPPGSSTPPPSDSIPPSSGGNNGGEAGGGGLPITGPQAGGLAAAGLVLLGGGTALMVIRHRRRVTFTSE